MGWLATTLALRPLLTAVIYTGTCLLPLALVSAQILQLEEDIGFRVGQLGLATAADLGAAAGGANPAGRIVARLGPGRSLRIGALLTLAACVIAGTAVAWWVIPLATAIGGWGNGLTQVASNLAIFDGVARERQGVGFGAKQAAVPLASVLAWHLAPGHRSGLRVAVGVCAGRIDRTHPRRIGSPPRHGPGRRQKRRAHGGAPEVARLPRHRRHRPNGRQWALTVRGAIGGGHRDR